MYVGISVFEGNNNNTASSDGNASIIINSLGPSDAIL